MYIYTHIYIYKQPTPKTPGGGGEGGCGAIQLRGALAAGHRPPRGPGPATHTYCQVGGVGFFDAEGFGSRAGVEHVDGCRCQRDGVDHHQHIQNLTGGRQPLLDLVLRLPYKCGGLSQQAIARRAAQVQPHL